MAYTPFKENSFKKRNTEEPKERKKVRIYTTAKINEMLQDIKKGYDIDMEPFFENNTSLRNANITFKMTDEEYHEWLKCSVDPIYFVKNYCKFLNDKGWTTVKLRDYQIDMIEMICSEYYDEYLEEYIPKNRETITMASRQIGKTTTLTAIFAHFLCFNFDKNGLLLANKAETAQEIMKKLKEVFKGLPFFLKPGVISWAERKITLDNGCYLAAKATTSTAATGDTIHFLLVDECSRIPKNLMTDFWTSVYPTLSSSKLSRIAIISTPNGRDNLFFDLWDGSQKGTNDFKNYRVDWWQVPGRDKEWADRMKRNFTEELFAQEFELQFDVETSKLLSAQDLRFLNRIKREFVNKQISIFNKAQNEHLFWRLDFSPVYDSAEGYYLFVVDTAEGKEEGVKGKKDSDYNVINIYKLSLMSLARIKKILKNKGKIELKDCIRLNQVGIYIDNDNDEEASAEVLKKLVFDLFKCGTGPIDNCRVLIEMNFNGKNFCNKFIDHKNWYDGIVIKTYHTKPVPGEKQKKKMGFKTTGGKHGKNYYCEAGAKMISQKQIITYQYHKKDNLSTFAQLNNFSKIKGTYAGIALHDDIAVTVFFACRAFEEAEFLEWLEQYLSEMEDSPLKSKIMIYLRIYSESEPEMSDSEFASSYTNSNPYPQMRNSYSNQHGIPGLPGTFTYGALIKR